MRLHPAEMIRVDITAQEISSFSTLEVRVE